RSPCVIPLVYVTNLSRLQAKNSSGAGRFPIASGLQSGLLAAAWGGKKGPVLFAYFWANRGADTMTIEGNDVYIALARIVVKKGSRTQSTCLEGKSWLIACVPFCRHQPPLSSVTGPRPGYDRLGRMISS